MGKGERSQGVNWKPDGVMAEDEKVRILTYNVGSDCDFDVFSLCIYINLLYYWLCCRCHFWSSYVLFMVKSLLLKINSI